MPTPAEAARQVPKLRTPAKTKAVALRSVKIRNTKRACWFFPFVIDDDTAAIARGDGRGRDGEAVPVLGLKVERGERTTTLDGKISTKSVAVCTIALGDSRAKVDLGDLAPELEIPGEVWAALKADPVQWRAMMALRKRGDISVYNDDDAVAMAA